ncbi:MAG: hypothetical protein UU93_C0009G0018 [Candidatus Amesbacteria bacterium GW2011_GWA2_42_12]|uniref:Uncharacterized protein n=1 Tax=Candidatus Amesbacteria bacterium GW2011_GWA2_42_12 TaxID=1618356 RepID=A0A0G0Y631_9BACT|nr:MAG: hypothetical protein UU93_C0009G0018 [Candidatus Amesbacteria bacterium GW2011_GWA2_42_12]
MGFNFEQAKGLSNFFFDIAKGVALGAIGFSVIEPIEIKVVVGLLSISFVYICVRIALLLLEEAR